MKKLLFGAIAFTLLITGCASTNSPYYVTEDKVKKINFLNDAELKALFTGKTIEGNHFKSQTKFSLSYNADGTYKGTIRDGAKMISGKWSVKDSTQCHTKPSGKKSCRKYYMKDGKYYSYNPENKYLTSSFITK